MFSEVRSFFCVLGLKNFNKIKVLLRSIFIKLSNIYFSRKIPNVKKYNRLVRGLTLYVYVTITFCPYLRDMAYEMVHNDPFFLLYYSLFGLLLNFIIRWYTNVWSYNSFDVKLLILINYICLISLNGMSFIFNFFKTKWLFIFFERTSNPFLKIIFFLKKFFEKFFIFWNPLFKRTSYFSFYKSNISKLY